jgi:hypothetical protein
MSTTTIYLIRESLLTMAQAARRFPPARLGRPVCAATLWRWCRKGVNVPGVGIVFLESIRVAGRWLTSEEALARFADRQTRPVNDNPAATPRTPVQRRRASERAGAKLRQLGI